MSSGRGWFKIPSPADNRAFVMAKRPHKEEIEFHPDAWERFERATAAVAKAPPHHRAAKKKKAGKKKMKKKAAP